MTSMIDLARLTLRTASVADLDAIEALHREAFGGADEARLVRGLSKGCDTLVSLVAEHDGCLAGHVLFSPVTIAPATAAAAALKVYGLAPMAVSPTMQSQGVGSRLIEHALARCRDTGVAAVVVLGHKHYYPRFGFRPAAEFGLDCVYDVPGDAFMALELQPGALQNVSGTVHYHPQFAAL